MQEQIISFQLAKLAKEKGFNNNIIIGNVYNNNPTQSLLQRWLREVHNIFVNADYFHGYKEDRFYYEIKIKSDENYCGNQDSDDNVYTYEEALEIGLQEALKLI